jgi:cytokinesis protein
LSLQKCKGDNLTAAEERISQEKRKQAAEENRANRQKALDASASLENEDTSVLDNLLEKLRNGDTVGRKARRARAIPDGQSKSPLALIPEGALPGTGGDAADIARDMLARLKSDGFEAFAPSAAPAPPRTRRRRRTGAESPRSPDTDEWATVALVSPVSEDSDVPPPIMPGS